ncbi:PPOX class F420-dependent oxidoreductase [Pseudokineococcus lusitanus]|uniref:Pyridoxamine 5'-phosphate oxidase N-terminal domain-containing protein n=1 Tax=Pseudokineococcus lusitanus TaxID=763993 RepID=A0A3N1HTH3_9ACTN|nr:PPOX class F420-dependent oxidoreductase [Pseudokineococcus lusitanus]ROP45767.1 hypothetical protein EDC03_0373 [Pseudokineococcus lusitanus]
MDAAARDRLLADLGGETYVSLVTYRRDGTPRPTPVWLVRDGDALLVTTGAASAKVRRARREPTGTVTPCDARGRTRDGAPTTPVSVEVLDDDAARSRVDELLRRKHPVAFRLIGLAHAAARLRRRGADEGQVVLRLRPRGS